MKNLLSILMGFAVVVLSASSCSSSDNETPSTTEGEPATLRIVLQGTETRAVGTPVLNEERAVHEFMVYIFNGSTNLLERAVQSTVNPTTTITNLRSGQKKIVVLANFGTGNYPTISAGQNYSVLAASALTMTDLQASIAANGLPISGEAAVTLAPGTNSETITVSRMVARVELGTVTVDPPASGITGVSIEDVYVMKARSSALVTAASTDLYIMDPAAIYLGGMVEPGLVTTQLAAYYGETFTTPIASDGTNQEVVDTDVYFYVFPNNGVAEPTLLTLMSNANGTTRYFPVELNDGVTGTGSMDGTFIKRNSIYTLNITLKHHDAGTEGPEDTPADLIVTLTVADWALPIVQDVVWE